VRGRGRGRSSEGYLSISRVSSSWGLQKDRYVVRKVRTKLGSGKREERDVEIKLTSNRATISS